MDENNIDMYHHHHYYYNCNTSIPSTGSGGGMMKNNIPAFGNWDYINDLPITQYFESASRQQGMGGGGPVISYSSSSSSSSAVAADQYYRDNYLIASAAHSSYNMGYAGNPGDHYLCGGVDFGRQYYPATAANFHTLRKSRKPSTGPPAHLKGARGRHREDKVPDLQDHFRFNKNTTSIAHGPQPPDAACSKKLKKKKQLLQNGELHPPHSRGGVVVVGRAPKAVDEDLYKIPTELLHSVTTTRSTRRKTKMGFVSRCLVPLCCVV